MPSFINNLTVPEPPYDCELAVFPVAVVPFALGALEERTKRFIWASDADWLRGEQLVRSLQVSLLTGCLDELLESNRQIYRLFDAAMFGRVYTVVTSDPLEISPAIPDVPDMTAANPGLVARIALIEKCLDNAMNGTQYTEFSDTPGVRAKLQELIDVIQQTGQLDDEMLEQLVQIGLLLA